MNNRTARDIRARLGGNTDFKMRTFCVGKRRYDVFFLEGMADAELLSRFVLEPLRCGEKAEESALPYCDVSEAASTEEAVEGILRGKAALVADRVLLFDVRRADKRTVEAPSEESAVMASKDSFVEDLKTNTVLLRKKIVSENLRFEGRQIGRQTHTAVTLVYLNNIVNDALLAHVRERLDRVDVDGVLTPDVLGQALQGKTRSAFPLTLTTERPDTVCRHLLAGHCAVLADGLPIAYLLPAAMAQCMTTPGDFTGQNLFTSVVRLMRYALIGVEVLLPGVYAAMTTFHYEMLPEKLALSIASAKAGVPFPVLFELLAMLALFEVLIEAGLHMPKSAGQAVSIVGALVVGEAAINADLVSPAALIIVAVSVICSFAMPNQALGNALRLWRVGITVAGALFGLFGVVSGAIVLLTRLASLASFGVPYLAPLAGVGRIRLKETLLVMPDEEVKTRPEELRVKNRRRAR